MKNTLLILSAIIVLASCGKYEKPFITFKSPENRLIDKTWKLDKIVDTTGAEITSNQTISFSISGSDSVLVRTVDNVTYTGTWNWLAALEGKLDKQRIETFINTPLNPSNPKLVYDVKVLSSKKMELVDLNGATTASYRYYFIKE